MVRLSTEFNYKVQLQTYINYISRHKGRAKESAFQNKKAK